jgi:hypothetical protein
LQRWAVFTAGQQTGFVSAKTNAEARRQVPADATLVLVTTYFRHSVKGGGPWWRLYRKQPHSDAPWQLYFEHGGKRYPLSLGSECLELAIETAKQKLSNHFEGHHDKFDAGRQSPRKARYATFGDVFAVRHHLAIDARTVKALDGYMWGTRFTLRLAAGLKHLSDADELSTELLTKSMGRDFFAKARSHARSLSCQAEQNKWFRTCNQAFNFCCALFAPRAVESMIEDHKLTLPATIGDFRARMKLDKLDGGSNEQFQRPPDAIIEHTLAEWEKLGRTPGYAIPGGAHRVVNRNEKVRDVEPLSEIARRNMFLAVGLSLAFGLRKTERTKVRWRHLQTQDGLQMLRARNTEIPNKGRYEFTEVVALDPFWTTFKRVVDANGWQGAPDDYVLAERTKQTGRCERAPGLQFSEGGGCDRTYWPGWDVSNWLRWLGWQTQKTNHALRDYGASLITMRFGLDSACRWCRHASRTTTESHYGHFVELSKMADKTKLEHIHWGKA